ncbi:MAG: hypothetical protein AAF849_11515 [Bacteroidota bacterium]
MTANLESRKLNIIEHLAEVDDESIVQQIENILHPSVDFWDQLFIVEKESIQKGIAQLDKGERVTYTAYRQKYQ